MARWGRAFQAWEEQEESPGSRAGQGGLENCGVSWEAGALAKRVGRGGRQGGPLVGSPEEWKSL